MALTFKSAPASNKVPPLLDTVGAAKLINLSPDYLKRDRWLAKSSGTPPKFPFYKIGGAVRYNQSEVLAVLENTRVG